MKERINNHNQFDGDKKLNHVVFHEEIVNKELLPKSIEEDIRDKNWY